MGYTVDLEADDLRCISKEAAEQAADRINGDLWMSPYHLHVVPEEREGQWILSIEHFQGDHWYEDRARSAWASIAPHMADDATLEFQGEEGERWRVRWKGGRCFEDYVREVVWAENEEIIAPAEQEQPS